MKRDLYQRLVEWKSSRARKPLLLQGARQTGKTYLLKEFGQGEYRNVLYCNFEENPGLAKLFQRDLNPDRILSEISIYMDKDIVPDQDLVIFDEIQTSNQALNSLKYFAEQRNDIHIAAAGSLLGVKLSGPGSFPVGKVNFLQLYPMTFLEFLDALGESRYRELLENIERYEPLSEPFHEHLIDLLHRYYFIGGMPEPVRSYAENGKGHGVRAIQEEIIKSYVFDFAKHAPAADIPKLTQIWESIPRHLARENKKFIFSAVKRGVRAREYENAITWLKDTGLIYKAHAVTIPKSPLKHYADTGSFKVYALDVGLLGALAATPVELLTEGERLFNEYQGAFVENYVAQQLTSDSNQSLYYWRSKGGKAEIDFICEFAGKIYPLEVKAGINPKSKSLQSYDQQFKTNRLLRANLLNLKKDDKICNFPLYAVSLLRKMVAANGPKL